MSNHAALVEQIHTVAAFRSEATFGTEPFDRLVAIELVLRADLAETIEHKQAQAVWRKRVDANRWRKRRRHVAPVDSEPIPA